MTLRVTNVEVPASPQAPEECLHDLLAAKLGIPRESILEIAILKKSLDARKKSRILYNFQVNVEVSDEAFVLSHNHRDVSPAQEALTADPLEGLDRKALDGRTRLKPVIVGTGPAGIFAALTLARAGQAAVIVERGQPVEQRLRDVNRLRRSGDFTSESNYCFGEGGAGTFSDGKLTCGRNHPLIRHVFREFVRFGGPEAILFDAHPHIGTDYLMQIARRMRLYLEEQGFEFRFGSPMTDFRSGGASARYDVVLGNGDVIPTDHLVLAVGHSARDTYEMLLAKGLAIAPKPFAMGARFEHPQEQIDQIQFGSCSFLPPAEYKLASQAGDRGIWTFCMCPGGHLLPTSAQPEHLAINGMSYHARNSGFANAAVVVNVRREDFFKGHPLDGMYYQADLERRAFKAGGGSYHSPAQRLGDFLAGRESRGELRSTYKPGVAAARLDRVLPDFIVESLRLALADYNKRMRGFITNDALVVGLESKTSSPISMLRGKDLQSISHPGFFPSGEGAGFAGGIISAALDGVRTGRAVLDDIVGASKAAVSM